MIKQVALCAAMASFLLAGCSSMAGSSLPATSKPADGSRAAMSTNGVPSCGTFGPNLTNSTQADLGQIATAMFASSGVPFPAGFLDQGPWFLLDTYGSGGLIGCQPTSSALYYEPGTRSNTFDFQGRLTQQSTTRSMPSGPNQPAAMHFTYTASTGYRIAYAEQFCFTSVNTLLNRITFTFTYTNARLTRIAVAADSGCPGASATYTYAYNSFIAPNLPSQVTVVSNGQTQTEQFTYAAYGTLLTNVQYSGGAGGSGYLGDGYSGMLITQQYNNSTNPLTISFNQASMQWTGATDARYNWGLTFGYTSNLVTSSTQNTGCPGQCGPSTYTYPGLPKTQATRLTASTQGCVAADRATQIANGRETVQNGFAYAAGSGQLVGPASLHWNDPLRANSGAYYLDTACT